MANAPTPLISFQSTAGVVLTHADARYAELRYLPGPRQPEALMQLLTALGHVLLRHDWHKFLADNRQMSPFTDSEKQWFVTQWLGGVVARPRPLTGVVALPENVFARLSFQEMYLRTTGAASSVHYRTFASYEPAEAYIRQLP